MNKISIFLLSAIALIMVSCGGKYDDARLMELAQKYDESRTLTDSEWKEVDKLFANGVDEWGKVVEGLYDQIKPGMTWDEASAIYYEQYKNFSGLREASDIVYFARDDKEHADIVKNMKATDDKLDDIRHKFNKKVTEKIGPRPEDEEFSSSDSSVDKTEDVESVEPAAQEFILTKDGLGPFTLGMSKSDVPSSIPGLYDSTSYNTFNHEEDMDIPLFIHGWMTFSLNGQDRFAITFDDKGKAIQISVQSPEIPTSLGITTASSVEKAAALPGAHVIEHVYIDGYEVDGFTIYCYDGITSIAIGEAY